MTNPSDKQWRRLAAAARRPVDERDAAAPYGFATRVAAQAFAAQRPMVASLLERFSLRALGVACLLAMVGVAANYSRIADLTAPSEDGFFMTDDPASVLLDVS